MWQHSACLGISQAEAEKDDFHFICRDCKRREEDAKKPKIPSLKFHIGSSSSPPTQKPRVVLPGANEGRKRKSVEGDAQMPPIKKYKPVNSKPQAPNPSIPTNAYPGGQTNGYSPHVNNNHYVPQLPPQAFHSPYATNGSHTNNNQSPIVGWSARYTPPQPPQQQQNYNLPPPASNPYANSFDRQRPSSSHSTNNVASPIKKVPSLSPPQHGTTSFGSSYSQTPQTNGTLHHQALPPTGPPAFSPVKQQSPKAAPLLGHAPSSSPVAHQPPLKANGLSSPGFSPTKHSPPRQVPPGQTIAGTPAVLPPAPQLLPSPRPQGGGMPPE